MASIDWCKATLQKAGAMKRHNGKYERVNGNHSNTDIDKSKSHLNIYIGADDYAPMLEKVKARIKEVDKKHPPKRNMGDKRITCILLETPVPQELTEQGLAEDFLRSAHKVIEDFFGVENVGGTCGHFDEQHYYTDKDGQERLSLVHGHSLVVAYAEWKDKKGNKRVGVNGKNCETKARLKALNKLMDDMCRSKYGVSYNTAETPDRKSVERLKQETALRLEADKLKKDISELINQKEQCLSNYLNNIPALKLEPEPPKPQEEPEPRPLYMGTRKEIKENEKEIKKWEKEHKKYINKVLVEWKRECEAIEQRNLQKTTEWEQKYRTIDNLKKAEEQILTKLSGINTMKQKIQYELDRTKAERKKAEAEKLQMELDHKRQIESYQNELQQALERELDKIFNGEPTSREKRLEMFCEGIKFNDGESVLDKFEQLEEEQKKAIRRGQKQDFLKK